MSATRIPFDLESPFIVASSELTYGGRRFGRGEAFPWRELGVEPLDLVRMWTFLQLDVAPTPAVDAPADGTGAEPRRPRRARG